MSPDLWAGCAVAVGLGGLVQGTIGVGFALLVSPVLVLLAPALLPGTVLLLMLPLNLYVVLREHTALDRRGTAWITAGRIAGAIIGLGVLAAIPGPRLRLFIGFATLLTVALSLVGGRFNLRRRFLIGAGVITGVTETATGIGGPPMALVYQHQPGPVLRATLAACFLIGEVVSLILLAAVHRLPLHQVTTALILLPALGLGALISRFLHGRLDGPPLRLAMLAFSMVSGVLCLVPY